jgi:hypothetical protein
MMRYTEVPWPWAGLTIALVLLAQEALVKLVGDSSSLALTSWRVWSGDRRHVAGVDFLRREARLPLGALTCAGSWAGHCAPIRLGLDPPAVLVAALAVIGSAHF